MESLKHFVQTLIEISRHSLFELEGGNSLELGELVVAILFVFVGLAISRKLSRMIANLSVVKRTGDASKINTLQSLLYYIFAFLTVLLAMNIANIPLTVFTVAGGAVAIGVGFGSQNLLNNFISGIILMFEQPIRIGDFVEMQGVFGKVEKIAFRSTRILAFGNKHIIYPNSYFLQNDFTNWTLEDAMVRSRLSVGVAYGSPTREVEKILLEAAKCHDRILERPEPKVVFSDFGDNSLVFDLYFSIHMKELADKFIISSDVRFKVDDLFRAANVTISFPQRDVHLDTLKPLQIEMMQKPS